MKYEELVKEINSRIDAFDLNFDKLKEQHQLNLKRDECYSLELNYKLSEGNVTLMINNHTSMPDSFVEEIKESFAKNFPYPYGKGI